MSLRLVVHAGTTLAPCRPMVGLPSQSEEIYSLYLSIQVDNYTYRTHVHEVAYYNFLTHLVYFTISDASKINKPYIALFARYIAFLHVFIIVSSHQLSFIMTSICSVERIDTARRVAYAAINWLLPFNFVLQHSSYARCHHSVNHIRRVSMSKPVTP